jgi:HlyD family secretion protein
MGGGMLDALTPIAAGLHLTPTQQAAFDAAASAMRERAAARRAPAATSRGNSLFGRTPGGPPREGGATAADSGALRQRMQARFEQQFAAFRASLDADQRARWDTAVAALLNARRAPLYRLVDGKPQQLNVRVGASDGSSTEVAGPLHAGDLVIVGAQRPTTASTQ